MSYPVQFFIFTAVLSTGALFLALIGQLLASATIYVFRGLLCPSKPVTLTLYTWRDIYAIIGPGAALRLFSQLLWVFSVYAVYLVIFPLLVLLVAVYTVGAMMEGNRV